MSEERGYYERVFDRVLGLFEGDAEAAERWLYSPRRALGGATPQGLAKAKDGVREVEALIGRIGHGAFS